MPDGGSQEIRVVLDAFNAESQKWQDLAKVMETERGQVRGLGLNPASFWCGNPFSAKELSETYDELHNLLITLLTEAEAEFHQIADALIIARDLYDGTDQTSAEKFVKIYGA